MKYSNKAIMRILVIVLMDVLLVVACGGVALLTRFDFSFTEIPMNQRSAMLAFMSIQCLVTLVSFWLLKMYHYVWHSVSVFDVANMVLSIAVAFVLSYAAALLLGHRLPISIAFIDLVLLLVTMVGMRCALRFYGVFLTAVAKHHVGEERIMLIGAGDGGRMLLREIQRGKSMAGRVCCIVDDNSSKWGKQMDGVPILGGRDSITQLAAEHKISQIIFAIPSASPADRRRILELCQQTGCKVRTLPGIYQLVNGEVSLSDVKDVQVEDLLGRERVELDTAAVRAFLRGRVVLVTGGGGSIGSELCRQIAQYRPDRLIILDIYENNAYDIQQELAAEYPALDLRVEIASVRDKERTYEVFDHYRPDVVFHAAAHKHVPLMEACPEEAVKNNIFGTYHVVRAAEKYGVEKFVMISTDKAVNPTNVMGASKRYCEMIIQSRESKTEFCAVRFGNVLGSNGSVVPLFKRQIEAGGPITITDKRIVRYFMTIPEAAQLVLEAGAMAKGGQIFVLDMGEPVKILDLAENLIRLSGLEPYKDIDIREIGLRPGEKLYEELLTKSETLSKTANNKIFVEQQEHIPSARILSQLKMLDEAVTGEVDKAGVVALLRNLVPTFYEADVINNVVGSEVQLSIDGFDEDMLDGGKLDGVGELA